MIGLIRRRVFELAGEDANAKVGQCPGESCKQFAERFPKVRGKSWKERAEEACAGCSSCDGNPPDEPEEEGSGPTSEEQDLADLIEDIVDWEDAGFETDWSEYDFEICRLARYWRQCEREIERLHTGRFQAVIKGFLK